VRLHVPRLSEGAEEEEDEEDEEEEEEDDVAQEQSVKGKMVDNVSTLVRPPWARTKRSWVEENVREKKTQRRGSIRGGDGRRWRGDDESEERGDRAGRKRKSKSLGASGVRHPSPPPRVKPPPPAAQEWRVEGDPISDYEDEEAEGWKNPLLLPVNDINVHRGAELLSSLGSVPILQASVGLAADSRFEGFPRPVRTYY
jgi:hypothetical protein